MRKRELIFPVGCFVWVQKWNSTDKEWGQILAYESMLVDIKGRQKPEYGAHVLTQEGYVRFIFMNQIAQWNIEAIKEHFA